MINLISCRQKEYVFVDNVKIWGQVICLNDEEKQVVSDKNLDYFILHNYKLTGKMEGNCDTK